VPADTWSKTGWTSPAPDWGLHGAEAVLKLRAIRANGDFPDYWAHHIAQERRRTHQPRYANAIIPHAA
jgi:hypothetical protein